MNAYRSITLRVTRMARPKLSITLATLVVLGSATTAVEARDRPGTPTDVGARSSGATMVSLSWRNTARRDEHVKFEVEPTKNGAPMHVGQPDGTSGTGSGWLGSHGYVIRDLEPEARYCLRVWSRYVENDVRSAIPSAWACADTPAYPPLAPLDVQAIVAAGNKHAVLKWNTPDQSNHRRITSYEIERQSPPGPNRPLLPEGSIAGPDGEQTVRTKLAHSFKSSAIDPTAKHEFRVCAVNSGGRTCARPVALVVDTAGIKDMQNPEALQASGALANSQADAVPSARQQRLRPGAITGVVAPPPPKILAPAAGSLIEQGKLRVQVVPTGAVARQAEVEFLWQPAAPKPDAMLVASPSLWAVPMTQLTSGVVVPEASSPRTAGRWIVRVRSADGAQGAWSEPVAFNLTAKTASSKSDQETPALVTKQATKLSGPAATTAVTNAPTKAAQDGRPRDHYRLP
jgi:Fibronectin type III domain